MEGEEEAEEKEKKRIKVKEVGEGTPAALNAIDEPENLGWNPICGLEASAAIVLRT